MFLSTRVVKGFVYACAAMAAMLFSGALSDVSAAQIVSFNDAWKYYNGTPSGTPQGTGYDDASWTTVYLPHPKTLTAVGAAASLGDCWYRKTFSGAAYQGKKLFLEFQGGMQTVWVYVNGTALPNSPHYGGYDPFAFDISSYVVSGSNVVAVRLNNNSDAAIPPGTSSVDFRYYGGLYREVYLWVTDSLHITHPLVANIAGGGGIFVTYPTITGTTSATVQVKTHVLNERASTQSYVVTTTILDATGANVTSNSTAAANINSGANTTVTQSLTVSNPHLWGPDAPYLYKVKSQLYTGGGSTLVDTLTTTIGIRRISFSKANGFQINGVRMILRGANRHQDYPYVGNAAPYRLQYADALRLKQYGFNFVRMSHYVDAKGFVDGCDKVGVMSQMAVPGWQNSGTAMDANSLSVIRNMIRFYRNSPSIILYETEHNESSDPQAYITSADNAVNAEYPGSTDQAFTTGEPTMSCSGDYGSGYAFDVIGTSAQHNGHGSNCIPTTSKPVVLNEYGDWEFSAGGNRCGRNTESGMVTLADNHLYSLSQDRAFTALQSDAVWSGIDYASNYNNGMVRSGAIDWARLPKFSAYFYRSQLNPSVTLSTAPSGPNVFIENWWTASSLTTFLVFSNCEQVSLYRNGTLVSTQNPVAASGHYTNLEHRPFSFTAPFSSGTTLRADGLIGGNVIVQHSVTTPGTASRVAVLIDTAYLPPLQADGSDMAFIYGSIVDANGTLMPTATNSVTFTVTGGNATIVATTEGTSVSVTAEAGVATAFLRAGTIAPATIIVTGTGPGTAGSDTIAIQGTGIDGPFATAAALPTIKTFAIRRKGSVLSIQVPYTAAKEFSATKFTLSNAQGKLVGQWNMTMSSMSVDIRSLPHGVYFGQVADGENRLVRKVAW